MQKPNNHDQPAEGGEDVVDRALQKQSEAAAKSQPDEPKSTPPDRKKDDK